jgi:hypothetical protein
MRGLNPSLDVNAEFLNDLQQAVGVRVTHAAGEVVL